MSSSHRLGLADTARSPSPYTGTKREFGCTTQPKSPFTGTKPEFGWVHVGSPLDHQSAARPSLRLSVTWTFPATEVSAPKPARLVSASLRTTIGIDERACVVRISGR